MKIEKISDNQIRCTLTPDDLKSRDIKISELTYGSGKARSLFREMMKTAFHDYGFRIDNTPLMVEAMPDSAGNLTLVITKVRDPEEIDSRFAHYTSEPSGDEYTFSSLARDMPGADDVLKSLTDLFAGVQDAGKDGDKNEQDAGKSESPAFRGAALIRRKDQKNAGQGETGKKNKGQLSTISDPELFGYTKFYMFHTLESVIRASKNIGPDYAGGNTLFRNPDDGEYYLLVRKESTGPERFNQICNALSEYGLPMDFTNGTDEFFHEHMKVIVADRALQQLKTL